MPCLFKKRTRQQICIEYPVNFSSLICLFLMLMTINCITIAHGSEVAYRRSKDKCGSQDFKDVCDSDIRKLYEKLFLDSIPRDAKLEKFVVSPYSLWQMSAIMYIATGGVTKEEFALLASPKHITNKELLNELVDKKIRYYPYLKTAQGFFVDPSVQLYDSFVQSVMKAFPDLHVANVPFKTDPSKSTKDINSWIGVATKDRLSEVVSPTDITQDTVCASVSTLLFDAKWASPFIPSENLYRSFYPAHGKQITCEMMTQVGAYDYYSQNGWTYAAIPYASNAANKGHFVCEIVIPRQRESFYDGFTSEYMDFVSLARQKKNMQYMSLTLPKVSLKQRLDLKNILRKIGVESAFTRNADFSFLTSLPLCLQNIFQETLLKINEDGTEIASATVATMMPRSCIPQKECTLDLVVDRPFFIIIIDNNHDTRHIPPLVFAYVGSIN